MGEAAITGIGWVNAGGLGQGRNSVFIEGHGKALPKLSGKDLFHKPLPRFGRMDQYSRLGMSAVALALKDAGLDGWTRARDMAIIVSTVYGCLVTDRDYFDTIMPEGGRLASPNLFAYTLPNTFLGEAAIRFGLTGASFAINESIPSGLIGLRIAVGSVAREECEAVLVGVCDAEIPPPLALKGPVSAGSLFFLLQGTPGEEGLSYGTLMETGKLSLLFDGREVEDLKLLALMCTEKFHDKKEKGKNR